MGPPARYPLQALLRLRQQIQGRRELDLAAAIRALEQAETDLGTARDRYQRALQELARRRQQAFERAAGPAGHRVADTLHVERIEVETRRLHAALERAEAGREAACQACEQARRVLAASAAELKVVESNRDAWDESRRQEALRRAEAELEDIMAARRHE